MAGLTISQFEQTIFSICGNSKIIQSVAQIQAGFDWVAIRAYISETLFLDVFYNERTGKTSYALIKNNQRIFGADNAKKQWHWHPFPAPHKHQIVEHEILFLDFLNAVEDYLGE